MIRDTALAEEAAAIGSNQDIIFDADAAEILIGLQLVEVKEVLTVSACFPIIDEGRDEIDARLVCYNKALLQSAPHAQTVRTELLQIRTGLLVETYVNLPETFHVVNIHAHHMSETVRQEHGMGSCADSLLCITLHQTEFLETISHQSADCKMHVCIFHARFSDFQHLVVTGLDDRIYLQLALVELTCDGHRASVVRTIVIEFAACVA